MKRLSSTTLRLAVAPESGVDATIYWLVPSVTQVKRKADGTHLPEYVSCESISKTGNSDPVKGIGTIKFLFVYKNGSISQESICPPRIPITSDIASISFRLYISGVLVDSKAVVVVDDGIKGDSGLPGPAGQKGQLVCPAGFWLNNVTYTSTKDYTPLVYYEAGKTYYVLNKLGDYVGINPSDDYAVNGVNATWIPFQNYKAIFTEMLMANFGKLSSAVFYGEYMFSQQGIDVNGNPTSNYSLFAPEKIGTSNCPFTPNVLINFLTGKIISLELDARGGQIGGLRIDELKGISLKVANMKVGGRNLILNSNQIINIDSSIGLNWAYMNLSTSNLKIGKTYILTCDNKTISGHLMTMLSDGMWSNNQIIEFNKPFVLQQLNTKFSITNNGAVGVASLSHIKLEAGNMPTDWSPAPEDIASKKELEDTGIDIYNKKIQFTADNATFIDNAGKPMGVFTNGSFNSELINASEIVTNGLTSKLISSVTIETGNIKIKDGAHIGNMSVYEGFLKCDIKDEYNVLIGGGVLPATGATRTTLYLEDKNDLTEAKKCTVVINSIYSPNHLNSLSDERESNIALSIPNGSVKVSPKSMMDVPGVVIAGRVSIGGTVQYQYGKRGRQPLSNLYAFAVSGDSNLVKIHHYLGHTNYTVFITPIRKESHWNKVTPIVNCIDINYFDLFFVDTGTENVHVPSDFSFVVIGENS